MTRGSLRAQVLRQLDSFWLVPALIAGALALLAVLLLVVDRESGSIGFAYQGGPGAARDVLAVLAGSVITVAGLTFSIMIVTLQLVAAQYTPRALRTFLADRMTQVVAGAFVGVFAYSLLVLRTIRGTGESPDSAEFVPSLSISVGILLGLVALVLLLAFVNHMSRSIQIAEMTARIARDTNRSLRTLYPEGQGDSAGDAIGVVLRAWNEQGPSGAVRSPRSGFVVAVDLEPLAAIAGPRSWKLRVVAKPGDFATRRTTLVEAWPPAAAAAEELQAAIEKAFSFANERDLRQDAVFGLRQLADIAIRALSPGVNDPTTAVTCLNHSQEVLELLAESPLPDRLRRFGPTVLVVERRSFGDALEPLCEIAVFAGGQPLVADCVLDVLARVASAADDAGYVERAREVARTAERIVTPLLEQAPTAQDQRELSERLAPIIARAR